VQKGKHHDKSEKRNYLIRVVVDFFSFSYQNQLWSFINKTKEKANTKAGTQQVHKQKQLIKKKNKKYNSVGVTYILIYVQKHCVFVSLR